MLDLQLAGTAFTGASGPTQLFQTSDSPGPAMTDEQLMRSSRWSRKMIAGRKFMSEDTELAEEVWASTISEVQRGWLEGPYAHEQLTSRFA